MVLPRDYIISLKILSNTFIEQKDANFVVRRGYDHEIKAYSAGPASPDEQQKYIDRFNKIYSDITLYSGRQLYDTLSASIDLEHYFTKLSIDLLLKNGDYTDEIIFYTKIKNGKEVFGFFPWDLDDLFAGQPHEIGNPWAPGSVFGKQGIFQHGRCYCRCRFEIVVFNRRRPRL